MGHNQEVSVSWLLATFMLMALGRLHLQTVVTVSLWLITQVCKVDSCPQINVHVLSTLHLFGNVAYCLMHRISNLVSSYLCVCVLVSIR